ncbi:MAG: CHAT domain-containing tetratricopeptide repeat protein [Bacteroidota bacterium]|nr:CHAT domain-containing tetratricopeptide repeat protein [Bacteroidota bacterium]
MGNTYISLKDYHTALEYYFKALNLYNNSPNHSLKNKIYPNIARSFAGLNQFDSANKYFEFALDLSDKSSYSNLITLYQNYGNFLMVHKKDLPASLSYYTKASRLIKEKFHPYHPRLKNIYVCIGDVHWRMHDMDSALYMYQKALKTIDTALVLDNYSRSPDFRLAADLESLNIIMRKIRVLEILLVDLEDRDLRSQYYEALLINVDYYKDAFASMLARKILLADQINSLKGDLKNMMDIGIEAAYKLYRENPRTFYLEKALAWSEAARSLILKTNFYVLYKADSSRAKLHEQAGKLKKKINALYFQVDELEKGPEMDSLNALIFNLNYRYDSLSQAIAERLPEFLKAGQMRQYDANTLIREIPDSTMILEYFLYRDRLHVFKMSGEGIEWHRVPFSDSLRKKVQDFTGLLKPENAHEEDFRTAYLENAHLLGEAIIPGGISPLVSNIVIIPDGMLHYFPFEIMHTRKTQSGAFRKMPYLLRDYNISYRYTLDTLENTIKSGKARILAVAPEISSFYRDDGKMISPIAEARAEADTLVKLYRGRMYSPVSEKEFAKIAGKYTILHFATHGIIDNRNPMNSHLLLQRDNDEVINLRLAEICNLELQADMAVLSACETGKGDILNGEGVLSLAWAFKYAGCPSVLMSLNLLDDQSAKKLMIRFYAYLNEGYRKDEALRKAKLDYLAEVPPFKTHPIYWAGLISTGDQSVVMLEENRGIRAYLLWIVSGAFILVAIIWLRRRRFKATGNKG